MLNCIAKYIKSKAHPLFLQIGAPTGTAAFLVDGKTLHALLKLPISNSKDAIKDLSGDRLRELQDDFKETELLVIDEKSMIGHIHFLHD